MDIRSIIYRMHGHSPGNVALIALYFMPYFELDGVATVFSGFKWGDATISGPSGWRYRGNEIPHTDCIVDVCCRYNGQQDFVMREPHLAYTVYLLRHHRDALSASPLFETGSTVYKEGFMQLRARSGCPVESCQKLVRRHDHTALVDIPSWGPTQVVDMRNVAWCPWCYSHRVQEAKAQGCIVIANEPNEFWFTFMWATVPWVVGDQTIPPGTLCDLQNFVGFRVNFPEDCSTWTGIF